MQINDYAYFAFAFDGYRVSDDALNGGDANTRYFGYLHRSGEWYIMRQVRSGTTVAYRFVKGASGYTTAWGGREALIYDYINVAFA